MFSSEKRKKKELTEILREETKNPQIELPSLPEGWDCEEKKIIEGYISKIWESREFEFPEDADKHSSFSYSISVNEDSVNYVVIQLLGELDRQEYNLKKRKNKVSDLKAKINGIESEIRELENEISECTSEKDFYETRVNDYIEKEKHENPELEDEDISLPPEMQEIMQKSRAVHSKRREKKKQRISYENDLPEKIEELETAKEYADKARRTRDNIALKLSYFLQNSLGEGHVFPAMPETEGMNINDIAKIEIPEMEKIPIQKKHYSGREKKKIFPSWKKIRNPVIAGSALLAFTAVLTGYSMTEKKEEKISDHEKKEKMNSPLQASIDPFLPETNTKKYDSVSIEIERNIRYGQSFTENYSRTGELPGMMAFFIQENNEGSRYFHMKKNNSKIEMPGIECSLEKMTIDTILGDVSINFSKRVDGIPNVQLFYIEDGNEIRKMPYSAFELNRGKGTLRLTPQATPEMEDGIYRMEVGMGVLCSYSFFMDVKTVKGEKLVGVVYEKDLDKCITLKHRIKNR